jgi:hypothetical protein
LEGTEGWIQIENEKPTYSPESLKTSVIGPNEIHLYQSNDHHRNFLDCVKAHRETAAPVEVGHRSVTICHLGNIAMMLKRKLRWNPEKECFINDAPANRMLERAMRTPCNLKNNNTTPGTSFQAFSQQDNEAGRGLPRANERGELTNHWCSRTCRLSW